MDATNKAPPKKGKAENRYYSIIASVASVASVASAASVASVAYACMYVWHPHDQLLVHHHAHLHRLCHRPLRHDLTQAAIYFDTMTASPLRPLPTFHSPSHRTHAPTQAIHTPPAPHPPPPIHLTKPPHHHQTWPTPCPPPPPPSSPSCAYKRWDNPSNYTAPRYAHCPDSADTASTAGQSAPPAH